MRDIKIVIGGNWWWPSTRDQLRIRGIKMGNMHLINKKVKEIKNWARGGVIG